MSLGSQHISMWAHTRRISAPFVNASVRQLMGVDATFAQPTPKKIGVTRCHDMVMVYFSRLVGSS